MRLIEAGLGHRLFYRIETNGKPRTVIVRIDSGISESQPHPALPVEPALEPIRAVFENRGIPVPLSYGASTTLGIDLLEDVGEKSLANMNRKLTPAQRHELYTQIVALVPRIQAVGEDVKTLPTFKRRLDRALIRYKGELFSQFSLSGINESVVKDAFQYIADVVEDSPARLAHRDLQSENVLLRVDRGGKLSPVLIDFQGAFFAPPEYDLVCLLRDSYITLGEEEIKTHLSTIAPKITGLTSEHLRSQRFSLLTISRKAKDHARFLHAARVGGDLRYIAYTRPTWRMICSAAADCAGIDPRIDRLADYLFDVSEDIACAP